VQFAKERLISLAADHVVPVVGGRIVDVLFELWDVASSIRALGGDHPVLEVPLPCPVPSLGLTLEIPLAAAGTARRFRRWRSASLPIPRR
jgi:hypothetical protein